MTNGTVVTVVNGIMTNFKSRHRKATYGDDYLFVTRNSSLFHRFLVVGAFYDYYDGYFDTCFVPNSNKIHVPFMSFTFQNNLQVDLDASGTLYVINKSLICLAFTNGGGDLASFGNAQQKTSDVIHDVVGQKLGFRPGMCTYCFHCITNTLNHFTSYCNK
ncbi:eukaryotic aspartyl protease family protein [Striga asiatica]|uniref:Eukaryotic aspartyl protease family protein n=1 Tax=Striga asiatica TaxID=4170 RepID=A0A5A7RCZ7_STRAF|nr:eukaryotic aspartyl protease family protein [Striga asiatica]